MCLALSIDHKNACDSKNKKVLIFFNSPLRYIFKVNLISVWYQYQRQYQCYRYLDRSAHLYQWSIIWCPCRWWITSGKIKELNKNGFLLNKVYRCDHADLFSRKVQLDSLKKNPNKCKEKNNVKIVAYGSWNCSCFWGGACQEKFKNCCIWGKEKKSVN